MQRLKHLLTANAFLIWILGVIVFAAIFPGLGDPDGVLPLIWIRRVGIFFIFFSQGVQLPGEALRKGLKEWRLHLTIHLCTFVLFPMVTGGLLWVASDVLDHPDLRLGFWFLSLLPTTITSAVALTSIAGGNVTGSLFNCTLSSIIGVFWVPFASVLFFGTTGSGEAPSNLPLFGSIGAVILLPLILGQCLRPTLGEFFEAHKTLMRRISTGVILFMVWGAFCQSFLRDVWSQVSTQNLTTSILGILFLLVVMSLLAWKLSGVLGLGADSRISAFFCGGQKTLALGLPMAVLLIGNVPGIELSLFLIPLMVYHPAQLILGGLLVPVFQNLTNPALVSNRKSIRRN